MYCGVLYGAKGLQNWATAERGSRFINPDGTKGDFFEPQKELNFEIKNLGNTLMALDSKLIIHSSDVLPDCEYTKPYFNSIEESKIFAGTLPKRCSIGELEDEYGNRYAVIQNRDFYKDAEFKLSLKDDFRVYEVSKEDGKQRIINDGANEITVKLNQGDAVLYRFQKATEKAFTIEYELAE